MTYTMTVWTELQYQKTRKYDPIHFPFRKYSVFIVGLDIT